MRYLKGETFGQRYKVDPTGLVLWLDQSDPRSYGDLSIWHDLSGEQNHGSQAVGANQPTITGADRLNGSARLFVSPDFISVADAAELKPSLITVSAWVYPSSLGGGNHAFVAKVNQPTFNGGYLIRHTSTDLIGACYVDGSYRVVTEAAVLSTNQWYKVDMTYDGSDLRLYRDGIEVDSLSQAGVITQPGGLLGIGRAITGDDFNGFIDIVMIFSRALTAAEANRLYLADVSRHGGL